MTLPPPEKEQPRNRFQGIKNRSSKSDSATRTAVILKKPYQNGQLGILLSASGRRTKDVFKVPFNGLFRILAPENTTPLGYVVIIADSQAGPKSTQYGGILAETYYTISLYPKPAIEETVP